MESAERRVRGTFNVIDARTGEILGSYFNDEGCCAIDTDVIRKELPQFKENVRIVKVNWPNYDEVEVFVESDDESSEESVSKIATPSALRPKPSTVAGRVTYTIYDNKNGEKLGSYTPKGEDAVLDKLALINTLHQYAKKSLRIIKVEQKNHREVDVYTRGRIETK